MDHNRSEAEPKQSGDSQRQTYRSKTDSGASRAWKGPFIGAGADQGFESGALVSTEGRKDSEEL